MKLKKIINKSYYGSVNYIGSIEDLGTIEQYLLYNISILKEFKNLIIATNYSGDFKIQNAKLWKKYFPNCVLIDLEKNRGHSFGTADLDNAIINYCKQHSIDWVCKTSQDVIFDKSILEMEVEEKKNFYYMNGIGYGGMEKYGFDLDKIESEYFYPQTNFYFLNTTKIDYLNDEDYLNETYEYIQGVKDYNGRIWEYIEGWTCEDFLKECITRNNISKYDLVPSKKYRILLETIKHLQIHDCSHKNIMIEGICHFQHPNQSVLTI